jgi:hypothetical protein
MSTNESGSIGAIVAFIDSNVPVSSICSTRWRAEMRM